MKQGLDVNKSGRIFNGFIWIATRQIPNAAVGSSSSSASGSGEAPRRDWVLNENYSENGIRIFRDPEWAYAKQAPSGAILGYWQSMEGLKVLREVNEGCHHRSIPNLVLIGSWASKGISKFEQDLVRPFPISPF